MAKFPHTHDSKRGFALVVTLSLMILLTVIAVGLLTLSSISLRSSTQGAYMAEARANASLALMLAIGDLQKHAGPDMRITATADILDAASSPRSPLTGVWKSWENTDINASGLPVAPDYSAKNMASSSSSPSGRFLSWLVSQPSLAAADPAAPPSLAVSSATVPLLHTGTLGVASTAVSQVHLVPNKVEHGGSRGGYAWWVGGENSKANLSYARKEPANMIEARDALASFSAPSPQPFGLTITTENALRMVSRESINLAASPQPAVESPFHDLTTSSRGLLTNTSSGGWRKDLSLLAEYGLANSLNPPTPGSPAVGGFLYPFAQMNPNPGRATWTRFAPIVHWPAILDALTLYKQIGGTGEPASFSSSFGSITNAGFDNECLRKVIRTPVVADIRYVLAYSAIPSETAPGSFDAALTMNPVVTLWNPWNYRISVEDMRINTSPLPVEMQFQLNDGATVTNRTINFYDLLKTNRNNSGLSRIELQFKTGTSKLVQLDPGETRVFSPAGGAMVDLDPDVSPRLVVSMNPGYATQGGYRLVLKDAAGLMLTGPGNAQLTISSMNITENNIYYNPASNLTGNSFIISAILNGTTRHYAPVRLQFNKPTAAAYYTPLTSFPAVGLSAAAASNAVFASSSLRFRTANDTRFPIKSGFNACPTATFIESGANAYRGNTPHSSPIEFDVWEHSGWSDSLLPNAQGYILTGIAANNGINRCILHEVPQRPARSLGELSHLQLRGPNAYPPFRTNIIANSAAHPICPPDKVDVPMGAWATHAMQFDDSYIANRYLFDDWFVSSIAPETSGWSGATARPIQQVYEDHVDGKKPLPNSAYFPSAKAAADKDLVVNTRHSTIASRLEVDGMFNINSTSVLAWKSLLGHGRDFDVPVLGPTGLSLATGAGHPISRTTVAGDASADGGLPGHRKFAGHRRLTDAQIDALAAGIVNQIRARGPALSLAEFVNRQLRPATDSRALAGTIQAALDTLANSPASTNPFAELQALCKPIVPADVPGAAGYLFPKAAEGWTGEGLPGWITQADILRSIAPVISARDDTFVIRTCGISYAPDGTTVRAKVWCEAIVRRQAEYVAPNIGIDPVSDDNLSGANAAINRKFGRRIEIVSLRYLSPVEI